MKDYYTIGEISQLFGLNIRTLRYYDKVNLIKPAYVDEHTHYRYYTSEHFEILNSIIYLRTLHMSIEKIKEFLNHKDTNTLMKVFQEQKIEIKKLKHELEICERKIDHRMTQLDNALTSPLDCIQLCYINERKALRLHRNLDKQGNIETYVREISCCYDIQSMIFLGKVAFCIDKEQLLKRQYHTFNSTIVILESEDEYTGEAYQLPEGLYVKIRYCGDHNDADQYYEKMLDYILEHQLQIVGDAIELSLIDYCYTMDKEKYVMELQIPVKKI